MPISRSGETAPLIEDNRLMSENTPTEDLVDLVAALNMLGDRLPQLIDDLQTLRATIPDHLCDALLGKLAAGGWAALAALCEEPGRILLDFAVLCRKHAETSGQPVAQLDAARNGQADQ